MNSNNRLTAVVLLLMALSIGIMSMPTTRAFDVELQNAQTILASRDYWPTLEWQNSTPEEQGMDGEMLNEMMDQIHQYNVLIDSILIVRSGYLVFEKYREWRYDADDRHIIHSCTKSYTSALVGIAIQEGYIESVDSKLVDFFPNRTIANFDERKQAITIEDLLTMTPGLDWDEWSEPYSSSENSLNQVWNAADSVQYILDLPMIAEPGEVWTYSSGASHLLGAIVARATGTSLFDYAIDKLFTPLGIPATNIYWPQDNRGRYWGHGGVEMIPRDMAKFGYLYLNNGTWDRDQIVPAEWVKRSSETIYSFTNFSGYSYQWWTYPTYKAEVFSAEGFSGQYIFVIPSLDMVVVFTSSVPPYEPYPQPAILFDYIIPAVLIESPKQMMTTDAIMLATLVILPLPFLIGVVYHRVKTRSWLWNSTKAQELMQ